jgi:hypothetical protein
MNVLEDAFTSFAQMLQPPPTGFHWEGHLDATLTGTKLPSLPAFVATIAVKDIYVYEPGAKLPKPPSAATIKFDATLQFQLVPSKQKGITVTLSQNPPSSGGGYGMKIVLPWKTVDCVANVDAASGVVYGSQGDQFVTLVLKASSKLEGGEPP